MVAVHLQKYAHYLEDVFGRRVELRYFRDIEGREVDFVLTEKSNPILAMECKLGGDEISKSLTYFKNKFTEVPCFQIHLNGKKDYTNLIGIRVAPAIEVLRTLV